MSDRPKPSPRPPTPLPDEPGTDPHALVTNGDMKKSLRANELFTMVTAIIAAGAALIVGYAVFISKAEAAGEKAAAAVAQDVARVKEDQNEVRQDVRALYRAVMYRQPQERLERPLPEKDAGP